MPNHGGMVDPFTGASSYRTAQAQAESASATSTSTNGTQRSIMPTGIHHFPTNKFVSFDACDAAKVLIKLKYVCPYVTYSCRSITNTFYLNFSANSI